MNPQEALLVLVGELRAQIDNQHNLIRQLTAELEASKAEADERRST